MSILSVQQSNQCGYTPLYSLENKQSTTSGVNQTSTNNIATVENATASANNVVSVSNNAIWKAWRSTDGANGRPPVFSICPVSMLTPTHSHLGAEIRELDRSIENALFRFHSGNASHDEIKELFEFAFETMVRIHTEIGFMDKAYDRDEFKSRILQQVLRNFQHHNGQGAISASQAQGERIAGIPQFMYDTEQHYKMQWSYFNSTFYFQEIEMFNFLTEFSRAFAMERSLTDPVKLMPSNYPFFSMQYSWFARFPQDVSPPRDFSVFKDLRNHRVTVSGVEIDREHIENIRSYDELKEMLLGLGLATSHLLFIQFINESWLRLTGNLWFENIDSTANNSSVQFSKVKNAYDIYSISGR
jgi:hypothetical protein